MSCSAMQRPMLTESSPVVNHAPGLYARRSSGSVATRVEPGLTPQAGLATRPAETLSLD
jgi:hypothetical protein